MSIPARPSRGAAAQRRDVTFARISRLRRWLIVATAAGTAAASAVVASITPKRANAHARTRAASPATSSRPRQSTARMPPLAGASQLGLRPPSSAPQATAPTGRSTPAAPAPQAATPTPTPPAATPAPAQAPVATSGGS